MQLTDALFDLCKSVERPIIAIDGRAGAGKTTLAEHLTASMSLKYKCTIVHMDDLYNGWQTPFDNNFTDSLLLAVNSHVNSQRYSLSFFNWKKNEFSAPQEIPQGELLVLEGVGALHSVIRPFLTASIWIDIEAKEGLKRVLSRDGDGISSQMHQWLIQQEEHFLHHKSQAAADFELTHP